MEIKRPSWDQYFMRMAFLAASRTNCTRRKVGAVIVNEKNVLATGYNGPPTGSAHCDSAGCLRNIMDVPSGERHELCRGLHAEQNAIIQAAVHGVSIRGSSMYVTTHPCVVCAKMLINAQIKEVVYAEGYPDDLSKLMILDSNIFMRRFELPEAEVASMIGNFTENESGED